MGDRGSMLQTDQEILICQYNLPNVLSTRSRAKEKRQVRWAHLYVRNGNQINKKVLYNRTFLVLRTI